MTEPVADGIVEMLLRVTVPHEYVLEVMKGFVAVASAVDGTVVESIDLIGLSKSNLNTLHGAGVHTVEDLCHQSIDDLARLGIKNPQIYSIRCALAALKPPCTLASIDIPAWDQLVMLQLTWAECKPLFDRFRTITDLQASSGFGLSDHQSETVHAALLALKRPFAEPPAGTLLSAFRINPQYLAAGGLAPTDTLGSINWPHVHLTLRENFMQPEQAEGWLRRMIGYLERHGYVHQPAV